MNLQLVVTCSHASNAVSIAAHCIRHSNCKLGHTYCCRYRLDHQWELLDCRHHQLYSLKDSFTQKLLICC